MSCRSEECHAALVELESLGLEEWTAQHTAALRKVVEACPECNREWRFFQQTILVVSTTSQVLPSAEQSKHMWQACSYRLQNPTERGAEPRLTNAIDTASSTSSVNKTPFWNNWFLQQPAWGWATLGAAVAVLLGVWLWAPSPDSAPAARTVSAPLPAMQAANDLENTSPAYSRPPAMASSLVNSHTMMEPGLFSNYVGHSLVSYSAVDASPRP